MRVAVYRDTELDGLYHSEALTVRNLMKVMSEKGLRALPIKKESNDSFLGIIADGDIRRYLAFGGELEDPIRKIVNLNPILIDQPMRLTDVKNHMLSHGVECLPLVIDGDLKELYVLWATNLESDLTAVVMAGGLGSRLAPLTDDCPKPLLKMNDKPILSYILEHLKSQGIHKVVVSLNYLGDQIMDYFGDGSQLDMQIEYVRESKRLGTGGALGLMDFEQLSDPFLCLNGDIINDIEVEKLQSKHFGNSWDATMVVCNHHYQMEYGVVKRNEHGDFLGNDEKPVVTFGINAGIYLLSKSVLSMIPKDEFFDLPSLFDLLRNRNMRCGTFLHAGRWIDIGTKAEFEKAKQIYES